MFRKLDCSIKSGQSAADNQKVCLLICHDSILGLSLLKTLPSLSIADAVIYRNSWYLSGRWPSLPVGGYGNRSVDV